mgnify:CR=1 FL=1
MGGCPFLNRPRSQITDSENDQSVISTQFGINYLAPKDEDDTNLINDKTQNKIEISISKDTNLCPFIPSALPLGGRSLTREIFQNLSGNA